MMNMSQVSLERENRQQQQKTFDRHFHQIHSSLLDKYIVHFAIIKITHQQKYQPHKKFSIF